MKIGIVNQGLGNVGSVCNAFKFYKYDVNLVDTPRGLEESDVIVLAGVGNFKMAADKLAKLGITEGLSEQALDRKKPVLGICLGMQLFADVSCEDGTTPGFGWIKGKVVKIEGEGVRVPHIGWDEVRPVEGRNHPVDGKMFEGMLYNSFYFMHSYHFLPEDRSVVTAVTRYGDMDIVSAVRKDNIVGVQFHPEKSQGDGLRFLRNFLSVMT